MNLSTDEVRALVARCNPGAHDGWNRLVSHLNGETWKPTTPPAPAAQPAPRVIKSLGEILDVESLAEATDSIIHEAIAEQAEPPPVMLSAEQAARRKVRTLAEVLNAEAGITTLSASEMDDSGEAKTHQFRIRTNGILQLK